MDLIENMMTNCIVINRATVDDPEGGTKDEWTEGAHIKCAIVCDSSMTAKRAEKEGVTSTYTITTRQDVTLKFHDVIKRESDGLYFRVTSNPEDKMSPSFSTINVTQVSAERWELTND